MRDILVSENVSGGAMEALKREFDVAFEPQLWKEQDKLLSSIGDSRGIIVRNQTKVDRELIAAAKKLKVIGRAGVGLDNIDVKAASDAGVVVVWTPEQNSISVAELAIGMMLSLARMIPVADRSTRGGGWERQKFTGVEMFGKTLGIVGLGRIGFLVATRAKALGMRIIAHDNFVSPDSFMVSESSATLVPLDELLKQSDVISLHLPATPQTRGMFNDDLFGKMKSNVIFINTSRGEVVDEAAMIRALQGKKIGSAALDVRAKEPPQPSPLHEMENVILTPHIAAFTVEGQRRVVESVCHDVAAVLRGEKPRYFVNFASPRAAQGTT
jgi:D-3-phosphoglycerate dehydrogenase / 2-oxoglutarate reductase